MKYSSAIVFATMASALPAPAPVDVDIVVPNYERRDSSVFLDERADSSSGLDTTLQSVYNSLAPGLVNDTQAIANALAAVKGNVGADVIASIQYDLMVNYNNIINALNASTAQIVASTTGAAGGAAGAIKGFTDAQLNAVVQDALKLIQLINNLKAVIVVQASTTLPAAIQSTLNQEIAALQQAIKPFVAPLYALANAAASTSIFALISVSGLGQLLNGISGIVTSFLKGLQ